MFNNITLEDMIFDLKANGWVLNAYLTLDIVNKKRVIKGVFCQGDLKETFYDIEENGLWIQLYDLIYDFKDEEKGEDNNG